MPSELPDLFRFANGDFVRRIEDWPRRRQELLAPLFEIEYGRLPPTPSATEGELLHPHTVRR